ncbi:hypothetical protein DL237_00635 [Pseudooceanicola sediminis]|uniref:Protein ImuA n=1 Tax=Pseudooceanicola sediminis TaxID=2211117 RepID=A0A399J5E2_9RHOB|nr:hypothetical protein [Pseudooceanicola sediminis]KAA2317094.1 hypothetical protein E0K93_01915 [Puniceibacterium sp. HSS470]RII40561.1 hypothetical protein DL237_00635 [Pseudooceanicola sediminis]|tara:strand:- start:172361 stop:172966 length:606 start_codon:yes stop_codon:yes gene_type:complete
MQPDFASVFPLRVGRVHECCGLGSAAFAAMVAASGQGGALWIRPEQRQKEALYPVGITSVFEPSRMLMAQTKTEVDSLAVAEEALRDGALSCVLIDITRPLDLREGRRLQLAARAGGTTGLCLIPEGMGSNAAETRWRVRPLFDPESEVSTLMRWEIIKNKAGILGVWNVRWSDEARRVQVVPPEDARSGSQGQHTQGPRG